VRAALIARDNIEVAYQPKTTKLRSHRALPTSFTSLSAGRELWWKLERRLAIARDQAGADGEVIAAQVNGAPRDLAYRSPKAMSSLRSASSRPPAGDHAPFGRARARPAVQELHPDAKLGIGPPVEMLLLRLDVRESFSPQDLKDLELKCGRSSSRASGSAAGSSPTNEHELSGPPAYKLELIGLKGGAAASQESRSRSAAVSDHLRQPGPSQRAACWKDCAGGPHVRPPGTSRRSRMRSGAPTARQREEPQLQRIYGPSWPSRAEQDEY